jgi:hypothetical protein
MCKMSSYFRTFVDRLCEIIFERSLCNLIVTLRDVLSCFFQINVPFSALQKWEVAERSSEHLSLAFGNRGPQASERAGFAKDTEV